MKFLKSEWTIGAFQLVFVIAVLAISLLLVGALSKLQDKRSPVTSEIAEHGAVELSVMMPEQKAFTPALTLNGVVQTQLRTNIAAQVGGKVVEVSPAFKPGGELKKGDMLFRIDRSDYALSVETANAEIAAAKSSLAQLEAEAALAVQEWTSLYPNEDIPDLAAKKPQIAAANARLQSAEAARKQAELALQRTKVVAHENIRILSTQLSIGQIISPNQTVGNAFPIDGLEISAPISQSDEAVISPVVGRKAELTGKSGAMEPMTGEIVRKDPSLDERTRLANLYIRPDSFDGLSVGEFMTVQVEGNVVSDAMFIPKSALSRNNEVWVVANNRLNARQVTQIGETETQVVVRRFHAADGLVILPPGDAAEGLEVTIRTGEN